MELSSILTRTVYVREIRCYKISVMIATAGQTCTIAIGLKDKANIPKFFNEFKCQIILVDVVHPPKIYWQFEVEFMLCDTVNDVTLSSNYEPVVFTETFKQSCFVVSQLKPSPALKMERIISKSKDKSFRKAEPIIGKRRSDSEVLSPNKRLFKPRPSIPEVILKAGNKSMLILRFKFKPQYVKLGQTVVIYDQKLKATGTITRIFED
jgi:GTPase